jgi:hypothetical protein
MVFPASSFALEVFAPQLLALPDGEVDIADRWIGQRRRFAIAERLVRVVNSRKRCPSTMHRTRGDARHPRCVLHVRESNEVHSENRTIRQVERAS